MITLLSKYKVLWFLAILVTLVCSISVTIAFENMYSDSVAITLSVLSGIALFIVFSALIVDIIEGICNP